MGDQWPYSGYPNQAPNSPPPGAGLYYSLFGQHYRSDEPAYQNQYGAPQIIHGGYSGYENIQSGYTDYSGYGNVQSIYGGYGNGESSYSGGYGHVGSSSQSSDLRPQQLPMNFEQMSINRHPTNTQIEKEDQNHGGGSSEKTEKGEGSGGSGSKELAIVSKLPYVRYSKPSSSSKWWGKSSKSEKCEICKSKYRTSELVSTLPCGHKFHQHCLYHWFKDNDSCCTCGKKVA